MKKVEIYDTTLRDGAQAEGIYFSGVSKLEIAKRLDAFGVDIIEGGFAASNPKDMEFFKAVKDEDLRHARIAAFGSTRHADTDPGEDRGIKALMDADTPVVTIFGKSWLLHVLEVLRTTEEENLAMISDTVAYLKENGKEVIYDAEHFYDGYKDSPDYAMATLEAADKAGADCVVPCDTNGGCLPHEIAEITAEVIERVDTRVGVHAHNDGELGVANSIEAVRVGAEHVQGTINGFGERTGNANLTSIIPNLVLKMERECACGKNLHELKGLSEHVCEQTNVRPNKRAPFVGGSAFAHKAGMHVDGVRKNRKSFEHIDPEAVGNERRILMSELSGASNVFLKAVEMGVEIERKSPEVKAILKQLEEMEKEGYEYESADASFKMLIKKVLKSHKHFFDLEGFRVIVEKRGKGESTISEATVKLRVGEEREFTVGEGDGPVDALNAALRRALLRFYPEISDVVLEDYKVRILDPEEATSAKTQVLIESSDGKERWGTVGVSENIIEASWEALVEGIEYKLFLEEEKGTSDE